MAATTSSPNTGAAARTPGSRTGLAGSACGSTINFSINRSHHIFFSIVIMYCFLGRKFYRHVKSIVTYFNVVLYPQ
jgi:hypothetical protein